jgi:putative ABC transport system substrate-binding protein
VTPLPPQYKIEPMDLANMRQNGVRSLEVACFGCRHEVVINVDNLASIAAPVHSDAEIETIITSLGREPETGLVVSGDSFMLVHRAPVILLAAQNNPPAIYFNEEFVREGGLLSYGPDYTDIFRRAAPYVDRILRGAKPADLPVQAPVKFNMALNAKTAKTLGLTVPQSILLRAEEVVE